MDTPAAAPSTALPPEFMITERPVPLPPGLLTLDLEEQIRKLLVRATQLESRLEGAEQNATKAQRSLLKSLLDIMDALDRLLQPDPPGEDALATLARQRRNIELTRKLFAKRLSNVGVTQMQLKGTLSEPSLAEVEDTELHPDLPDETVVSEIISGYWWNEEVLRTAKVIVSRSR